MTATCRVTISEFGPPEVMSVIADELAPPAANEAQLRHTAIGFNYLDVYQRRGDIPLPLPTGLGLEAAGIVEALGPGVDGLKPGDRVVTMNGGLGTYSERRNVPADKLVKLPDTISDEVAATIFFKGMTAQYLICATHRVKAGDLLLVHSAAGGVGQILARWAVAEGAVVIGATGSPRKKDAILAAGCAAAVATSEPDWPAAFLQATGGRKADVVYDAVGKDTLVKSFDCAAPFGLVVSYGGASGSPPAIAPDLLRQKGNLFFTAPSVFDHNADSDSLRAHAADLFDAIAKGYAGVTIGARFPLDRIVDAHRAAEGRKVEGAILITP